MTRTTCRILSSLVRHHLQQPPDCHHRRSQCCRPLTPTDFRAQDRHLRPPSVGSSLRLQLLPLTFSLFFNFLIFLTISKCFTYHPLMFGDIFLQVRSVLSDYQIKPANKYVNLFCWNL